MAQNQHEGERIAKVIARAGLCSRREAEAWIAAGRVAVNGEKIASPALNVKSADKIVVDGKPLPGVERTRLFLYHKPRGLVTTSSDPQGRPTIFGALPKHLPRLISIGRLDLATEGLLLLTNDGGLARALELPSTAWLRRYRVRAHGKVTQEQLDTLREGVTVDGINYGPIEATLDREQASNVWITFAIREGKNREVRNVLRHLGLHVARLIRVSFGPFQLADLAEGGIEEVPTRVLRDQLGEKLARAAGADFSAPIVQRKPELEPPVERKAGPRERPAPLPPRAKRDGGEAGSPARQRDGAPRSGVGGKTKREKRPPSKFARPRRGENARPSFDERDEPRRRRTLGQASTPMRIVGGRLRGRALAAPKSQAIRPTADRLREALFNILTHAYGDPIAGARVLDLFAGTGALGLEAVSRGAAFALFIDDGAEARALLRQNVEALGLAAVTRIFRRDATKLGPAHPVEPFSLAFLDAPYGKGLAERALSSARDGGWLTDHALIVVEETVGAFKTPAAFEEIERRAYDDTEFVILRLFPAK